MTPESYLLALTVDARVRRSQWQPSEHSVQVGNGLPSDRALQRKDSLWPPLLPFWSGQRAEDKWRKLLIASNDEGAAKKSLPKFGGEDRLNSQFKGANRNLFGIHTVLKCISFPSIK